MGATRSQLHDHVHPGRAPRSSTKTMAFTGIPRELAEWVNGMNLSPYALTRCLSSSTWCSGTAWTASA
jgi:hypothetical protein